MFISHFLKKAYFRVPKTGSSTQAFLLRLADVATEDDVVTSIAIGDFKSSNVGAVEERQRQHSSESRDVIQRMAMMPQHFTPQHAVDAKLITQEQMEEYQVFICCRNPLDRYLSAFKHKARRLPLVEDFRLEIEMDIDYGLLTRPTHDYVYCGGVMVADLLDFDKYKEETKRLLSAFGADIFPVIPRMNRASRSVVLNDTPTDAHYWTPTHKQKILDKFALDVELYEDMKAGAYK